MIAAEPTPQRNSVQMTLPHMSFEIKGMEYDAVSRHQLSSLSLALPPLAVKL